MKEFTGYIKGINLGGWLSQCCHEKEHYDSFISEEDIKEIASWGADHVRLPVDYNLLETVEGKIKDEGFEYINKAVEWCGKYNLNIIIDLHKAAGYSFDEGENESGFFESEQLQEHFYKLWDEIALRYGKMSDRVSFELLNEVTDKEYCGIWNSIINKCIMRIRKYAPDTIIIVGGYWQNSPDAVKDLDKPYDDKIVYTFHCYDPLKFTHQGGYWVKDMPTDFRMRYTESGMNEQYFTQRFAEAVAAAQKYDIPIYCGEYGVIENAEPEDVVSWYRDINAAFVKLGIARAAWSYRKMDFGICDSRMDKVRNELVKYL